MRSKWRNEGTQSGALAGVIAAFALAFRHGLLARNPIAAAREEFQGAENRRAMTLPEYQALLRHAGDGAFRRFLVMLWWTGARCGELAGIRWHQVDFERRLIVLKKHKAWKKTRLPRLIPLGAVALGLLAWMHERAEDPVDGLVFQNRNGNAWDAPQRSLRAMRCKMRAGLGRDVVLHMMRHSFATRLLLAGCPLKWASEALGHFSQATTERIYAHLRTEQAMGEIAERIDDFLSGPLPAVLAGKKPTPDADHRPKTVPRCMAAIRDVMRDAGEMDSAELDRILTARGYGSMTINRARRQLGIVPVRTGGPHGKWTIRLPAVQPAEPVSIRKKGGVA